MHNTTNISDSFKHVNVRIVGSYFLRPTSHPWCLHGCSSVHRNTNPSSLSTHRPRLGLSSHGLPGYRITRSDQTYADPHIARPTLKCVMEKLKRSRAAGKSVARAALPHGRDEGLGRCSASEGRLHTGGRSRDGQVTHHRSGHAKMRCSLPSPWPFQAKRAAHDSMQAQQRCAV